MSESVPIRTGPALPSNLDLLRILATNRRHRRSHYLQSFRAMSPRRAIVTIALIIPGGLFLFLAIVVAMAIGFGRANSSASAEYLLSTMLLVTLATSVAGCLSTALQSLFMNNEVRFLVNLPIPMRLIFYDKFGDVAKGAIPGALFGIAVSLGFVLGRAESYAFVMFAAIAIALLSATAISLSAGITALVVRLAPPRKARSFLVATSLVILAGTSMTWRTLNLGKGGSSDPDTRVLHIISLLPSGWAREAMVRAIGNHPGTALPFLGLQFGVLMLVAAAGAATFASTFAQNLERTDLRAIAPTPRPAPRIARRILRLVPLRFIHWVKREWLIVSRDFSRLSAAVLPVASVSLWIISTVVWSNSDRGWSGENFWLKHGPLLILPWGVSISTTVFAFGAEGHAIGLIRSLPVRPLTLMTGKYIAYAIPVTGLCVAAGFLSLAAQPGSRQNGYLLIALLIWLSTSFCAIDLSVAASSPRFESEHVQRSTGFLARLISAAAGLVTAALIAGGMALSPIGSDGLYGIISADAPQSTPLLWLTMLVAGTAIPVALFAFGTRRLGVLLARD